MITILLATYNGMAYLPDLIASLTAQTCQDFRVCMQDDLSTDGTREFLESVQNSDPRFSLSPERKHLGASGNFFSLLRAAEGYTAFCDQDDLWHPRRLETCMQHMRSAEARFGADTPILVHSDLRMISADGTVLEESFVRHQGWDIRATGLNRLLVTNNATGSTMLINEPLRQLAAAADDTKVFMHDWWIAKTCAAAGTIIPLDEPLVDYRQHDGNAVGASSGGTVSRVADALLHPEKTRRRIQETFDEARLLLETYRNVLPEESIRTLESFLAVREAPKFKRYQKLRQGGFLMPGRAARLAQALLS